MRLNLGCSDRWLPDFVNVDCYRQEPRFGFQYEIADLSDPWPWPDSSVDLIVAHDIVEHLPDKIRTMNEGHRVLKPGGIFEIRVPTTDGRGAWQDPTHISFWTPNDWRYYCVDGAEWQRFRAAYGITAAFRLKRSQPERFPDQVVYEHVWLEAVK